MVGGRSIPGAKRNGRMVHRQNFRFAQRRPAHRHRRQQRDRRLSPRRHLLRQQQLLRSFGRAGLRGHPDQPGGGPDRAGSHLSGSDVLRRSAFRLPVARLRIRAHPRPVRGRSQAEAEEIRSGAAWRRSLRGRLREKIMDTTPNEVRKLNFDDYSTAKHLEHAAQQARARNYQDFLIVDVDAHHYENESYKEVFQYIESPVIRHDVMDSAQRPGRSGLLNSSVGNQNLGGRITRSNLRRLQKVPQDGRHRDVAMTVEWMDSLGVDYACLFPTPMLFLGLHPQVEIEVALCRAYNRWLCERILAVEPRLISMLYLPFNDPEAAYQTVKDFGDKKGVVGFMVTSPRYKPVHDNAYMKTYALLEELGKPISFHAAYSWEDRALQMTNRFISVHSLGFMWFNMIHMTNWVINGLPERFPKLKVMWIESGLTWAYSLMQRLDHSYMMRTSDCPSLKRRPSEYMREMFYSSQPMEKPDDPSILEATFKIINAETQLVWSSDYPHWDFDLPSVIYDLPFVKEDAKRNILGGNSARLFGLDPKPVKKIP